MTRIARLCAVVGGLFVMISLIQWAFSLWKPPNRIHGRVAVIPIDLAARGVWKSSPYFPPRRGDYTLSLEAQNLKPMLHRSATYIGTLVIDLEDADGQLVSSHQESGHSFNFTNDDFIHETDLETFRVTKHPPVPWIVRVSVTEPDPKFAGYYAAVIVSPPSRLNFAWSPLHEELEQMGWDFIGGIFIFLSAILYFTSDYLYHHRI